MTALENNLTAELKDRLPGCKADDVQQVILVMAGGTIVRPMDELALSLLSSGHQIGELLSALLHCELLSVTHMMEHTAPDTIKAQVALFSECIESFNVLQSAMIHVASQNWQAAIDDERKGRVIAECRASWIQTGSLIIHNYFHEIPVSAKVPFIGLEHKMVWLGMMPEMAAVFSASEKMNTALISNEDRSFNLVVEVLQRQSQRLVLSIIGVEPAMRERRSDVRVQLDHPLPLKLAWQGKSANPEIANLSCSGLGIMMQQGPLPRTGEKVRCSWSMGQDSVVIDGTMSWTRNEGETAFAGVHFKAEAREREKIYKFLFVIQQSIIGRLRRLEAPGWMQAKGS